MSERAADVYDAICHYAAAHNGATPNTRQIAALMGFSQQRASRLLLVLFHAGRICWLNRYSYIVVPVTHECPLSDNNP